MIFSEKARIQVVKMPGEDPVHILQDICLKHKLPDPKYEDITNEFDEYYEYSIEAFGSMCTGKGDSRKDAKHNAASNMLKLVKSNFQSENVGSVEPPGELFNYIGALYEECMKSKLQLPIFDIVMVSKKSERLKFTSTCTVRNIKVEAEGFSKKEAKHASAKAMIMRLFSKQSVSNNHQIKRLPDQNSTSEIYLNIDPEQYDSAKRLLTNAPSTCDQKRCLEDVLQILGLTHNIYQHSEDVGGKKVFELKYTSTYVQINDDNTSMYTEALNFLRELLQVN